MIALTGPRVRSPSAPPTYEIANPPAADLSICLSIQLDPRYGRPDVLRFDSIGRANGESQARNAAACRVNDSWNWNREPCPRVEIRQEDFVGQVLARPIGVRDGIISPWMPFTTRVG